MYATKLTCFLLLLLAFSSCKQSSSSTGKLKNDHLPSQLVTISTSRDNYIRLAGGTIIQVPANALKSANGDSVKLEIKEALTIEQMIAGSLYTRSNGELLGSGGMLYVGPQEGQDVKILQPLKVIVPADYVQADMQLFKGEIKDSAINWVDPQPLEINRADTRLANGQTLFKSNCSPCHAVTQKLTGPPLYGAIQRMNNDTATVYEFTRNPAAILAKSCQAQCVFNQYKIQMTAFPSFTDADLEDIYQYIHEEGMKEFGGMPAEFADNHSCDSCDYIRSLEDSLSNVKGGFSLSYDVPGNVYIPVVEPTLTQPPPSNYSFNIETFGWYNVDFYTKTHSGVVNKKLKVVQQGLTTPALYPILVIPSALIMQAGSLSSDGSYFYFDDENGSVSLPPGLPGKIFTLGERGDTLLFGITSFETGKDQTIKVNVKISTKEEVESVVKGLKLQDVKVTVTKTNEEIADQLQTMLDSLKKRFPYCACTNN